jgi:MSHA pilin protein MshC
MQKGKILKNRIISCKGFTLIEIIATLLMLMIIAAVAISRVSGTDEAKLQAEVDTLKGHLRYAQYLAMNDVSPVRWGIQISGQSYTLIKNSTGDGAAFTSPYSLPGESSATHSMTPLSATVINVLFDEWGAPYNAATKMAANTTISVSTQSITITPETGFIP